MNLGTARHPDLARRLPGERQGHLAPATSSCRSWRVRAWWLIAALLVFRLLYAAWAPFDLVHDEAYYWDWSRHLDWGYYSKPPMVAWLIAATTSWWAPTEFLVRLPAVLLGTGGLLLIYELGHRLYGPRVGFLAVLVSMATPGNAALSLIMTIDAPLMFCWAAALNSCWRFLERGPHRTRWAAATACAVGFGLLSKQTMIAFPVLLCLFLLLSPEDRHELRRPALWLVFAGAALFLLPVVYWNATHDWITLEHTRGHFGGESVGLAKRLTRSLEFIGAQFAVISPLTCALVAALLMAGLRHYRRAGRPARYLLALSAPPLAGVLALSLRQRVEPNWPAPFYTAALVLLAGWAAGSVNVGPLCLPGRSRAFRRAVVVGLLFAGATYALPLALSLAGLEGSRLDPLVRLRGWQELGRQLGARLANQPRPNDTLMLVASNRTEASELGFYMPGRPAVYLWSPSSVVTSQYDLWELPRAQGCDALILTRADRDLPRQLERSFEHLERLPDVSVAVGNGRRLRYRLYRGERLRDWPGRPWEVARQPAAAPARR